MIAADSRRTSEGSLPSNASLCYVPQDHMHWGVEIARKGGVPADRVLNTMSLSDIVRHLKRKRRRAVRAA
jgi:hypothetical protein